jgi:hypothetical protein
MLRIALVFTSALTAMCLHAAEATPEQIFLANPHLGQNVVTTAARSTVMLRHACQDAAYVAADPVELVPMKFDSLGGPLSGELKFPVAETGCGISRQLNVRLWVEHENSITMTPMMPGSSHADQGLQQQAYPYVLAAAGGPEPKCTMTYVEDTNFQGSSGQTWKEVWTLASCGWRAEVPVIFTTTPHGVKVTAGPKKAVKRLPVG